IDFCEEHHIGETHRIAGTVTRIVAECWESPAKETDGQCCSMIYNELQSADGWESELADDETTKRSFSGYIVELKDVKVEPIEESKIKVVTDEDLYFKDGYFDMDYLLPEWTGLIHKVWVGVNNVEPQPTVRIFIDGRCVAFSVCDNPDVSGASNLMTPEQIADTKRWILLNKDTLIDYWQINIDTKEFLERIEGLEGQMNLCRKAYLGKMECRQNQTPKE
ncbi:MAG: hypothetical protein J6W13_00590, partial [Salinivirgaceae bacterium]|nr:hypothetical protein [Salinivirgaceae bacterium]